MKAILFSGGYDSTYLLNKLIKEEREVMVICINSNILRDSKNKRESKAREKIINYLKAKYYNCNILVNKINVDFDVCNLYNRGLSQPLIWLSFMQLLFAQDQEHELQLSYINGDDALNHVQEIKQIMELSSRFQSKSNRKINITFPLMYYNKDEILARLIKEDKFLFENATSCEGHEENCGICAPCIHFKSAMISVYINAKYFCLNDDDVYYCRDFINDRFKIDIKYISDNKGVINIEDTNNNNNVEG